MEKNVTMENLSSGNVEADSARAEFLTLPLGRLMLKNALPAVASMLFMALYQAVDAMLVGRRLGPEALASVNILYPILAVFVGLAVMIGVGGNARIAVLLGSGETKQARRTLGLIVALGVGLGLTGSVVVAVFFPQILAVLGTSGSLGIFAGEYLRTMYPFATMMILFFILEQSVRNDGQAGLAAMVMAGMALLNIALDYLFLFVLNLGIGGAALATGISQSLGALIFVCYFWRKTLLRQDGLCFATPGGGVPVLLSIAANGSSELFNSLAVGVTTFLFNRIILSYVGAMGVAAFSVTQYLLAVGMMVFMGLGNGAQPILSYNHGAGLTERVQGTLIRLLGTSMVIGFLFFVVMRFQAASLAGLFIADHPEALATTLRVAATVSWSMLFIPVGIVVSVFFTALEKAEKSLIIAVCRGFVFTVTGLALFPLLWGETGIWITPVFAEGATALVGTVLLYRWLAGNSPVFSMEAVVDGENI
ncbi:MATE family efflux transporter [Dethiobacter alkaliphilus]|uniref:Multidrug export protein MepA n=1 Tax=Dethiobacter alkaliphilus AHT 1 TaxID=555088 RepID=C0GGL6_DETAL|nr:MATE family efflux transporter [Dethiobacter alkaliphilus]EEG77457.1 multi antimicrobial extrusion protein MatE [Dethiobacter alkaliphilus AHT 1]